MTYGVEIKNGNGRVVLDEGHGIITVDPVSASLAPQDGGTGNPVMYWRTYCLRYQSARLPLLAPDANTRSFYFMHGIGSSTYDHLAATYLRVLNYGNNPTGASYPVRYLIDSSDYIANVPGAQAALHPYGLRIFKTTGGAILFDSSFTIAKVVSRGLLIAGQDITIPPGCAVCVPKSRYASYQNMNAWQIPFLSRTSQGAGTFRVRHRYWSPSLSDDLATDNSGQTLGIYFVVDLSGAPPN